MRDAGITPQPPSVKRRMVASNALLTSVDWNFPCTFHIPLSPASGLQHMCFVQGADGEAFHGCLQVFADFK
jgi:hypothetical protein